VNKNELAQAVADSTGLGSGDAKKAVEAVVDTISGQLSSGNEVSIAGFGKFSISERSARQGRNPATGETIQIAASKGVKFSAASALKSSVNG
jgi:DNA-binding protein HU-beta